MYLNNEYIKVDLYIFVVSYISTETVDSNQQSFLSYNSYKIIL